MKKKTLFSLVVLSLTLVVPAFAAGNGHGCNVKKVAGSYTRPSQVDVGSGPQNYVFQLNLNADGTAYQNWTGLPELMNTLGTGSPDVGSWKCQNGQVVLTVLSATFVPVEAVNPFTGDPTELDITLLLHRRTTHLFDVIDDDHLMRVEAVVRSYSPTEDPTDPNAGTLGAVQFTATPYDRLVASDADLN